MSWQSSLIPCLGGLSPSLSLALGGFSPHKTEKLNIWRSAEHKVKRIIFSWAAVGSEKEMICVSRESSVTEPCVVMRNMRQVMNGLKNYTGELPKKFLHFTIFTFLHSYILPFLHVTIFTLLPFLCNHSEQRGR